MAAVNCIGLQSGGPTHRGSLLGSDAICSRAEASRHEKCVAASEDYLLVKHCEDTMNGCIIAVLAGSQELIQR
jgi:hypothetical protein